MKKQFVNIALAALAVGLVVAVLVTSGRVTTSEKQARENNLLAAYREDQISKLTIEQKGKRLVVERSTGADAGENSWLIREPVNEEADAVAVQKLLGSLEFASVLRRIKPEEVNRERFGIDAPRLVFTVEMGAVSYRLKVGADAASPAGAAYLEISGDAVPKKRVVIVSKDLVKELSMTPSDLRGQEMMPYLSASLAKLKLEGEGGARYFRRAEWGGFRFDGMNGEQRVEREVFDRILLQFARTKAEHFIDLKTAESALAKGKSVVITMVPSDAQRPAGSITVGGRCPDGEGAVALRKKPDEAAACVPDSVLPALFTTAEELRDRGLFSLRRDEVESLDITMSGKRLELERKGEGFILRYPQKGDVDLEAGNQRIDAILGTKGTLLESANLKELGLDPAPNHVTLKSVVREDGKVREETLFVSAAGKNGGAHVRRSVDGAVLEIDREALRVLVPDATLVRSRKILSFAERDLVALHIKGDGQEQRLARTPAGRYELTVPKGFEYDAGLVSDVVDGLSTLVTDRWIADDDDGSYGFEKPKLEVTVTLPGGDGKTPKDQTLVTLVIGEATSGGAFGMLRGSPGVFVFPKRVLAALETPLIDRGPFIVEAATTARIVLEHQGTMLTLERQGEEFVARGAKTDLTKGRIQQIVDALENLRAESALHIGPPRPNEGFDKPQLGVISDSATTGGDMKKTVRFHVGTADAWRSMSIFYGRVEGIDATFVLARSKVNQILEAL